MNCPQRYRITEPLFHRVRPQAQPLRCREFRPGSIARSPLDSGRERQAPAAVSDSLMAARRSALRPKSRSPTRFSRPRFVPEVPVPPAARRPRQTDRRAARGAHDVNRCVPDVGGRRPRLARDLMGFRSPGSGLNRLFAHWQDPAVPVAMAAARRPGAVPGRLCRPSRVAGHARSRGSNRRSERDPSDAPARETDRRWPPPAGQPRRCR
jgi:hypothetical protein